MTELHPVRAHILYQLRHTQAARFSELMKQTALESDSFKFHIRALKHAGYIVKYDDGYYWLTVSGKELANNLSQSGLQQLKQPKLSVIVLVLRSTASGAPEYLLQRRERQPFYGYWGFVSGPVLWGQSFEETARQELAKQCGIAVTNCTVRSCIRQRDLTQVGALLEDKLFVVVEAAVQAADLLEWRGGQTVWMSAAQLQEHEKVFETSLHVVKSLEERKALDSFAELSTHYDVADY